MALRKAVFAVAGLALLAACAQQENILPGARENLRGEAIEIDLPANSRAIRLASQTANTSWTHRIGTPAYRTAHPALSTQPTLAWSASIGEGEGRRQRISTDPVIADGRIFTMDSTATLQATGTDGSALWRIDLTPGGDRPTDASGGGLAYNDGTIYAASGFGRLYAIDAATGQISWEQRLGTTGNGTPTIYGDLVYLISGDQVAWAINKDTGRVEWQLNSSPDVTNLQVAGAPAVSDRFVVFGFGSGEVQTAFRRGGVRFWDAGVQGERLGRAISTIGDITGDPVISGSRVYVANHSGRLVALDLNTGERLWTAEQGALSPVWPAGDSLFLVNEQNQLLRVDANTGETIWARQLANFVKPRPRRQVELYAHYGPVLAGGRLIVASSDGALRSYDPENGALLYSTEIPDGAASNPIVAGRTLYVLGKKGELHAFR